MIPSVPEAQDNILRDQKSSNFRMDITRDSLPDIYLPPDDEDIDALEEPDNGALVDGLAFASGTTSPCVPIVESKATPQKKYDYSDSIRSEPKVKEFHPSIPLSNLTSNPPQPSPFDEFRNIALRKPLGRTRTPLLSQAVSPPPSPCENPTPQIMRSNSLSVSPAVTAPDPLRTAPPAASSQEELIEGDDASLDDYELSAHERSYAHEKELSTIEEETPSQSHSREFRDPTFSSDGDPDGLVHKNRALAAPFSSPAPTPHVTSDFTALPLNSHTPSTPVPQDLVTPQTRRRSFLLDVVNSGARPRMRFPTHPLAQTYVPSKASESGEETEDISLSETGGLPQVQGGRESGRASFVPTTSSPDLTTQHRMNTSFDPALSMGEGHGVGRFNATKLNSYLHGLNNKRPQGNEGPVTRPKQVEDDKGRNDEAVEERRITELMSQKQELLEDKARLEHALAEESAARAKDKEKWMERMIELEKGDRAIIQDLEQKWAKAEKKASDAEKNKVEACRREADAEKDRAIAMERADKAERALESGRELGGELKKANERIEQVMGDLRNANKLVRQLESEAVISDGRIDELEKQLKEACKFEEEPHSQAFALRTPGEPLVNVCSNFRLFKTILMGIITVIVVKH